MIIKPDLWEKEVKLKNGMHMYFFGFKTYTCIQSYKMFYFKQRHFHKNSKYSWIPGIQQSVQQRRPWGVREGQYVRKNWISEFFQQTFVDTWTFIFKITTSFSGNNFNFSILRIIKWKKYIYTHTHKLSIHAVRPGLGFSYNDVSLTP